MCAPSLTFESILLELTIKQFKFVDFFKIKNNL